MSVPQVSYPTALDSNYTLFNVYNSSQSILAKDLNIEDINIEVVPKDTEIWADNGFITISSELIYYDKIERNKNNKVYLLKNCVRNLEGQAEFYLSGTAIYGNVVAQLQNQLVDAVLAIEDTIGDISGILNFTPQRAKGLTTLAEVDHTFSQSLNNTLTTMLGYAPVGDDNCPDVEFDFNITGSLAEFCVRIYGEYVSFQIDFGDGNSTTQELSGTHQYSGGGPWNPTVTVVTYTCTIIQSPTTPDEAYAAPTLVDPAISFVILIPEVPPFPSFIPPKLICPGPLFNLPPIIFPEINLCPSAISTSSIDVNSCKTIISIIEVCKTPQIIRVVSPCKISIISLVGCSMPSVISLVGCCPPSVISIIGPTFNLISFTTPPIFAPISFMIPPCVSFCDPPTISFAPFPTMGKVSFDILVDLSLSPICFCEPPSFAPIKFDSPPSFTSIKFDNLPPVSVIWGIPPTISVTLACQTSTTPQSFAMAEEMDMVDMPVSYGLPEEIRIIAPKISDIKLIHSLPKTIELLSHLPKSIILDATQVPKRIMLEPAANFPSVIRLEPLQVTGIPKTIEIIENIPRTIQLLMPDDPFIEIKYKGSPFELKLSPNTEKLLSNLIIQ